MEERPTIDSANAIAAGGIEAVLAVPQIPLLNALLRDLDMKDPDTLGASLQDPLIQALAGGASISSKEIIDALKSCFWETVDRRFAERPATTPGEDAAACALVEILTQPLAYSADDKHPDEVRLFRVMMACWPDEYLAGSTTRLARVGCSPETGGPSARASRLAIVSAMHWAAARREITLWGNRGLHAIKVGSFVSAAHKRRSFMRQRMLGSCIPMLVDCLDRSVLDLACNDGFWSFQFGHWGAREALGIDSSAENVFRARTLAKISGYDSFRFEQANVFDAVRESSTSFDIVLLLSILYHLGADSDFPAFFKELGRCTRECLIIDTRWFDDGTYWFKQTFVDTTTPKWRPRRAEVFDLLKASGFQQIIEVRPERFLPDLQDARGDGDPYSLASAADYVTGNRSLVIGFKNPRDLSNCAASDWRSVIE